MSDRDLDPLEADLNLADAAKLVPGRPCHMTLWRWMTRGIKGIRLDSVIVAGVRRTNREALRRFLQATTDAADGVRTPRTKSPKARQKSIDEAIEELEEAGI